MVMFDVPRVTRQDCVTV